MTPKACDHCYRNKEKCSFAPSAKVCGRCQNLRIGCFTSRRKKRKGRRPALRPFGQGSLQIWELGQDDEADANNAKPIVRILEDHHNQTSIVPVHTEISAQQGENSEGMPLRSFLFLEELWPHSTPQTASEAISIVMNDAKFEMLHIPFAIGPSFMQAFRMAICSVIYHSGSIIMDGYQAFLGLVAHCQASGSLWAAPDLHRGAKALSNLRNAEILGPHDALCVLLLGQALFVFDMLSDTCTTSAHTILRSALISTKRWYPVLNRVPAFDTVTFCPVLMDIVECLVHRKTPIIRLWDQDRVIVDRYAGLCSTLLPLLHGLCEQSHAAKFNAVTPNRSWSDLEHTEDCYADIEASIKLWVPRVPPNFFTAYGTAEREMMITQANAYRLVALLVIHRLRFPLGVRDSLGQHYANCILHEISLFLSQSNEQSSIGFPIAFPIFIAMFEVEGLEEGLLETLRRFPIQRICILKLHDFVRHVRRVKELGYTDLWFDLVEANLTHTVIP